MNRINTLARCITTLLSCLLSLSIAGCLSSSKPEKHKTESQPQYDVIVVGAGIAGVKAAKDLVEQGLNVMVLEAQNKIGGRLKVNRELGIPFDEGASWIHGAGTHNPIAEVAGLAGLNTVETVSDKVEVYDIDGHEYNNQIQVKQDRDFAASLREVRSEGDLSKSFQFVFEQLNPKFINERYKNYMLSAYLEFDTGGDISKLSSTQFYDDEAFDGPEMLSVNGYDHITEYIAQGLNVKTNSLVTAIHYGNDIVEISVANGTVYSAKATIVTVPLGVLKNNKITFSPSLPEVKQQAINSVHMGNVNKFLLIWDRSFWSDEVHYIGYTSEQKGRFNYFLNVNQFVLNSNALMTFAFGDEADETEHQSDEEVISEVLDNLSKIYGNAVPKKKPKLLRTNWRSNPYSYGAYSFAGIDSDTDDFEKLAEPISNKLFFAGEHTSRNYRGTVHGAYLSGERAAKEIMAQR